MLLITEYHITWSCFDGSFAGNIFKHIFNWKYLYVSLNLTEMYSPWSIVYWTINQHWSGNQGWGQFRNWNWNWYQFQFQELELQRNWIKGIGIGIGIDKEELKELIQFLFLIVNSFWFFAVFLAESLNQFDLQPFWIQLARISLDRYIILYDDLSIKCILHGSYWLHSLSYMSWILH